MKGITVILLLAVAGILSAYSTDSTTTLHVVERSTTDIWAEVSPEGETVGDI